VSVSITASLGLFAYRIASYLGTPLVRRHLKKRAAAGKEDTDRLDERFGHPSRPRPEGRLIWLHGASVGESLSLLPLITWLRASYPSIEILVTTGTMTSAKLMAERLPSGAVHHYLPVDLSSAVWRFLYHWRPDLVIWTESEIWPNLLAALARRRIPRALVNGRMSVDSHQKWTRMKPVIAKLLGGFDLCLMQTREDATRFSDLGASNVSVAGNLKFAAAPLPADAADLARIESLCGDRPRWVAASTHPGEEEIIAEVHVALAKSHPDLLTIIVPRHPDRGPDIAASLISNGLKIATRSAHQNISSDTDIYLADTLGELGLWYRLCNIAFIGGSLVEHGGQNPLEAARLGCAIIAGPYMDNFMAIVDGLDNDRAILRASDSAHLAEVVANLLDDDVARKALIKAALNYTASEAEVLNRITTALTPLLKVMN
jgi:3-deoxy-D-manno-octulosonic-acid transferase